MSGAFGDESADGPVNDVYDLECPIHKSKIHESQNQIPRRVYAMLQCAHPFRVQKSIVFKKKNMRARSLPA
jgi:hypothetical protein